MFVLVLSGCGIGQGLRANSICSGSGAALQPLASEA